VVEEKDLLPLVERLRGALPEVTQLLRGILDASARDDLSKPQKTARGLVDRAVCWLGTLHALNRASHFQAHAAGLRGLVELTVDLALLCEDQSANERIEAWEVSEKLNHAAAMVAYVRAGGKTNRDMARAHAYLEEKQNDVDASRERFWKTKKHPKGKHPQRWTGRSLRHDVESVDERYPLLAIGQMYAEQYRFLCWCIHGSGLTITRGFEGQSVLSIAGIAYIGAATLGLACGELALRTLDLFNFEWQRKLRDTQEGWLLRYGGINPAEQ
jgi:hypothetical protein